MCKTLDNKFLTMFEYPFPYDSFNTAIQHYVLPLLCGPICEMFV